jgi:predicted MFS family arabinose efflux permease
MSPLVPGTAKLADMPLERAAGLFSAANRVGLLVGLPLAGGLIGLTSPATVVLLDGISFAVAALGIAMFVPPAAAVEQREGPLTVRAYLHDLGEGLAFLRADRLLLGLSAMIALTNLFDQALTSVLLPVWVRERLHSPSGLGIIGGALGLGLLGGVLLGSWLGPRLPRWATYAFGFLLSSSPPFFVLAAADRLPVIVVVAVVCGVLGGVLNPLIGAVLFERVPPELQARVLGMSKASAWLGIPFGSLLGGLLASAAGLSAALVMFGVAMLVTTLAPFVFPVWREMNRKPAPVAA